MRRAFAGVVALLALVVAGPVASHGDPAAGAAVSVPEAYAPWVEALQQASRRLVEARRQLMDAEASLRRARHRHYPRGEALARLRDEVEAARSALDRAERERAELLDQARRAGVPPGYLRAFEEDVGEAPSPAAPPP